MGDSLPLTHVHTRDGSGLPASALVTCVAEEADKEGEMEKGWFKHKGFHHL